jgi:hypothetical protein
MHCTFPWTISYQLRLSAVDVEVNGLGNEEVVHVLILRYGSGHFNVAPDQSKRNPGKGMPSKVSQWASSGAST